MTDPLNAMGDSNDSASADRAPSIAAISSADEWSRADADADLGDRERPVIFTRTAGNGAGGGLLVEQAERISSASVASSASVLALAGSLLGDAEREAQLDVSLEPAFFDASAEEPDAAFLAASASAARVSAPARDTSSGWNMRALGCATVPVPYDSVPIVRALNLTLVYSFTSSSISCVADNSSWVNVTGGSSENADERRGPVVELKTPGICGFDLWIPHALKRGLWISTLQCIVSTLLYTVYCTV